MLIDTTEDDKGMSHESGWSLDHQRGEDVSFCAEGGQL